MTVLQMPNHCYGVKGAKGTYRTDPGGRVHVDDPSEVRRILKDPVIAGDIIEVKSMPRNAKSITCECGFVAFTFTKDCPKCGLHLSKAINNQ